MGQERDSHGLGTLEKCVQILTLFTDEAPTLHVSDIVEALQLPRSTAYRYMAALRAHRFIEEAANGGYRLGSRILELAATITRRPLAEIAYPFMEEIARLTGETVILCGLRRHVGVCLEKVDGTHALRVAHELGDTYPLHAGATGKAIFAFLDPRVQRAILDDVGLQPFTETTITKEERLMKELEGIRKNGYSESKGEAIRGTYGIAVPLFAASGRIQASIGVSVPAHRGEGEARLRLIELLVDAGQRITNELKTRTARE